MSMRYIMEEVHEAHYGRGSAIPPSRSLACWEGIAPSYTAIHSQSFTRQSESFNCMVARIQKFSQGNHKLDLWDLYTAGCREIWKQVSIAVCSHKPPLSLPCRTNTDQGVVQGQTLDCTSYARPRIKYDSTSQVRLKGFLGSPYCS
jgi:hypothetical protein